MDAWLATNLVAAAFLPPFFPLWLMVAALVLCRRRPSFAMSLLLVSAVALYLLATPWVGGLLLKSLEISRPIDLSAPPAADAIVVLGGGRRKDAAEYGGDTPNSLTFDRLRYAARLYRATQLPVLVTGGKPGGGTRAEGVLMRDALIQELGTPVRWVESAAITTWDNARLSAHLLQGDGVKRIYLVSHAWHLRRAVPCFEAQGFAVIPAGTQFAQTRLDTPLALLPTAMGLRDSSFALHEWLGILWYRIRTRFA
jgi:uncharacterized SAM-binding protein YcdF (DUF218 family)